MIIPQEIGYIENLNGKLRNELTNDGFFYNMMETQILIEE